MARAMTIRERCEAFWAGDRPDRIPYTIYHNEWRHTADDPRWRPLYERGLGVTLPFASSRSTTTETTWDTTDWTEGGERWRKQTITTPVGEVWQTWRNGWHHQYLLKSAADYRVMIWLAEHTTVEPLPDGYARTVARAREILGDNADSAVLHDAIGRTPLQTILVDYAGLEQFVYHLCDFPDAVEELYAALLPLVRRRAEFACAAPGPYVGFLENFTAESLGPQLYAKYLLPVYEEVIPWLHAAGKIVGTHYDGRTACCRELIAGAPMDLIESLTEPNEGDQTLAEARAAWPDKLFWCNIRVGDYDLPPDRLKAVVHRLIDDGAVAGRRLAFEVSEQYPANWQTSLGIVLEAIEEHG